MCGIHPNKCIHKIYIVENYREIRQPQSHMNLILKEILKEELQKLLDVNFVYQIVDSH
jgi:hypothetical protein